MCTNKLHNWHCKNKGCTGIKLSTTEANPATLGFFLPYQQNKSYMRGTVPNSTYSKPEPATRAAPCTQPVNSDRLSAQTLGTEKVHFHQIVFPPKGLHSADRFGVGIRNTVLARAEAHQAQTVILPTRELTYWLLKKDDPISQPTGTDGTRASNPQSLLFPSDTHLLSITRMHSEHGPSPESDHCFLAHLFIQVYHSTFSILTTTERKRFFLLVPRFVILSAASLSEGRKQSNIETPFLGDAIPTPVTKALKLLAHLYAQPAAPKSSVS